MIFYNKTIVRFFFFFSLTTIGNCQDFGVTVFGTNSFTSEEITDRWIDELHQLKKIYDSDRESYHRKCTEIENKLYEMGDFSYVRIQLFKSYYDEYDFIFDFVESRDAKRRLNFREVGVKKINDSLGLITKWKDYQELSFKLYKKGEIDDYSCPVVHCLWSFNHEKLEPYLNFFNTYVPTQRNLLIDILNNSDSASQRASAAFLLAHSQMSDENLLKTLLPSIRDSESAVRNNSLRVIYYIVRSSPQIKFNIAEVIDALDFPSFTDRNKALVILRSVSLNNLNQVNKIRLINILISILEKKDAHNYKNAHTVLKNISQKQFDSNNIKMWKNWAIEFLSEE